MFYSLKCICKYRLRNGGHFVQGRRWVKTAFKSWWRHEMETLSALLAFCAGNSPVTSEFPTQRPVTPSFDVFFDLRLNQQLGKQWRRRWFETSSHSLWRHCNVLPSPGGELNCKCTVWIWICSVGQQEMLKNFSFNENSMFEGNFSMNVFKYFCLVCCYKVWGQTIPHHLNDNFYNKRCKIHLWKSDGVEIQPGHRD